MKFRTFAIGYVLVLAVYLFAKSHSAVPQSANHFSRVVDLTRPELTPHDVRATAIEIPAHAPILPKITQTLSPFTTSLVVLDVRAEMNHDPSHQISVEDIADWEQAHGEIPPGSVVIVRTDLNLTASHTFAGFSLDSAQFLVQGRDVLALGSDAPTAEVITGDGSSNKFARDVYHLANVANLESVPLSGSMIEVSVPDSHQTRTVPVQLKAMVR